MELKKKLEREVENILGFIQNWENISKSRNSNHLGLFSGLTGLIVVLLDIYTKQQSLVEKQKIKEYFLHSLDIIENNETLLASYCDGLSGYGFFLLKLKQSNVFLDETDAEILIQIDDILVQIDEILEEQIEVFFEQDNHDLLHGVIGLGIYFLEKDKLDLVNKIVGFLIERSSIKDDQVFWKKYDKYKTYTTVIDMGNAHGNSSILYFLSKILVKIPTDERIKNLIKGNITFYLKNKQALNDSICTYFPTLINATDFENNTHKPENSRLAWCYGDLGTLYTLLIVTIQINENVIYNDIVAMLKNLAQRRLETESFVIDSGFCHGTSGIAVIFDKIYNHTGKNIFLETSKYWIEETLKYKNKELNSIPSIGYSFQITDTNEQNFSLLEGLTGLLYCYLNFLFQDMPLTDETLLLKF
jgi:lantibiotic biosynthesis protein